MARSPSNSRPSMTTNTHEPEPESIVFPEFDPDFDHREDTLAPKIDYDYPVDDDEEEEGEG